MASNNVKTTRAVRERILELYTSGDHAAAQAEADRHGLKSNYAWRLASERGLVPRTYKNWGKLREIA